MKQKLSGEWKFHLQEQSKTSFYDKDLWARDYDDSAWKNVFVPNDWAVAYPFDEKNSSGTAYLRGGIGWYRYHFTVDSENSSKNAFLLFDGVYKHCKVWCNGWYLGSWQNGYTSFGFDISESLKRDGTENVIAVCIEHEDIADCRWYTGSGIMRPVHIKYTEGAYLPDDGVYFHSENNADITVETKIQNLLEKPQNVECTVQLADKTGAVVYKETKQVALKAESCESTVFTTTLQNVHVWSDKTPDLYQLQVQVFADGALSDEYVDSVGIRTLRFDADKGFFCNGVNTKLKGLCLHEDAGCFGNAVPADVWEARLKKLQDAGCNAIRMSHNPHSDELYALCDRLGLFVMDELYDEWANPKNKWTHGHNVYPPSHQGITGDFASCYEKDVRSFVIRRRNHPSVIMWSIGNEIDYPNDPYCSPKFKEMTGNNDASKPAAERQYNPNHPDITQMRRITKMLSREVKKWDTTRPVTLALAFPELSSQIGVIDFLDVVGYNYKEQFYEADHKRFPAKMFVGSENHHTLAAWQAVKNNEYIAGQFLWTGVDYLGEAAGWPVHGADFGLLDMAGFEKTRFFQRKAWWSTEPFVKLYTAPAEAAAALNADSAGCDVWKESWNYADGQSVTVRIYTNESSVTLSVNGKAGSAISVGEQGYADITIPYASGTLAAKTASASDELVTAGALSDLEPQIRYGREIIQIELRAKDAQGALCTLATEPVNVQVTGKVALCGIENGDLADVTAYCSPYRKLFNGRVIVYLRPLQAQGDAVVHLSAGAVQKELSLHW